MTTVKIILLFLVVLLLGGVGGFVASAHLTAHIYAEIMAECLIKG